MEKKAHWETVYQTKSPQEVSWTQEIPQTSLDLITSFPISTTDAIIDVGGGDSKLVDFLLEKGYENITVLDISEKAIQRAQQRLGELAKKVTWVVSDITAFEPQQTYAVWHDRAAFHFLTTSAEKQAYLKLVHQVAKGFLVIGTFSETGPLKCSGLEIQQYSSESLKKQFESHFDLLHAKEEDHKTPFNTTQNFIFGSFKRKAENDV